MKQNNSSKTWRFFTTDTNFREPQDNESTSPDRAGSKYNKKSSQMIVELPERRERQGIYFVWDSFRCRNSFVCSYFRTRLSELMNTTRVAIVEFYLMIVLNRSRKCLSNFTGTILRSSWDCSVTLRWCTSLSFNGYFGGNARAHLERMLRARCDPIVRIGQDTDRLLHVAIWTGYSCESFGIAQSHLIELWTWRHLKTDSQWHGSILS